MILYYTVLHCFESCPVVSNGVAVDYTGSNRQLIRPITFNFLPPLSQKFYVFSDVSGCHFSHFFCIPEALKVLWGPLKGSEQSTANDKSPFTKLTTLVMGDLSLFSCKVRTD